MIAFIMKRMCRLSYFVPIIIKFNKIKIDSTIYITINRKEFANPYAEDNYKILKI